VTGDCFVETEVGRAGEGGERSPINLAASDEDQGEAFPRRSAEGIRSVFGLGNLEQGILGGVGVAAAQAARSVQARVFIRSRIEQRADEGGDVGKSHVEDVRAKIWLKRTATSSVIGFGSSTV
jgi:hypothetical protein